MRTDARDLYLYVMLIVAAVLAVAAIDERPHSHDGGRTYHAHPGGDR